MGLYTTLLCTTPSFLEGLARILDFEGSLDLYNMSSTPEKADEIAIASDWWAVGDDFRSVIRKAASENKIEISDGR